MTKNPLHNALAAFSYIVFIASILYTISRTSSNQPDNNFFIPIFMLSLLVLSVATMSYVFFYTPLTLLQNGKADQAAKLFLKTLLYFGIFTSLACVALVLAPY